MSRRVLKRSGAVALVCGLLLSGGGAIAQKATDSVAVPQFDVSTVKLNDTGSGSIHISINDDLLRTTNVQLKQLLEAAFEIKQEQIYGLPDWAKANHYDIVAKVVDADPKQLKDLTRKQREQMLQNLLIERFHLQTHIEKRTLPLLNLVVVKDGIKFEEFKKPVGDAKDNSGSMNTHNTDMVGTGLPISSLVSFLAEQTHTPVVDKTDLHGQYNFHLQWAREEEGPQNGLRDDTLPSIYTAVQEQLGLKLEPGKGPVNTLVIDRIELPTEN